MTVFAIIRQTGTDLEKLGAAIAKVYPDDNYDLGEGAWLVSGLSTAKDVCDKLGISDRQVGSAIVIEAASYYGMANPAIWSWIKSKWESRSNG